MRVEVREAEMGSLRRMMERDWDWRVVRVLRVSEVLESMVGGCKAFMIRNCRKDIVDALFIFAV